MITDLKNGAENFVIKNARNQWVHGLIGSAYLRKSIRCNDDRIIHVLDIASVEIREAFRGKGHFTDFLDYITELAHYYGYDAVLVENVLSPRLAAFMSKQDGFKKIGESISPSFIKILA